MSESTQPLSNFIGKTFDDNFEEFDLVEIQQVLASLKSEEPIVDISKCEWFQQKALRGSDVISEYLGKIVKLTSFFESKINSAKNKAALEYTAKEGRTTAEMKKQAGECSPDIEQWVEKLAKVKAAKTLLEKKYDTLVRTHYHYKEIANGLRRGMIKVPNGNNGEDW